MNKYKIQQLFLHKICSLGMYLNFSVSTKILATHTCTSEKSPHHNNKQPFSSHKQKITRSNMASSKNQAETSTPDP